jgi:hypothetical protein
MERATELLHFQDRDLAAIVRSVDRLWQTHAPRLQGKKRGLDRNFCWKLHEGKVTNGSPTTGIEIFWRIRVSRLIQLELKGRDLEDIRPSGLGLHFIRQSMDRVEFDAANVRISFA